MSINTTYLMGRVGRDVEVRTVGQGNSKVATFSLCTGGKYKTNDGREVDDTAWHSIVAWRNLADLAEKYIRKGSQILVVGRLSYREYTDNNGNKKNVTDIVADKIELCGSKDASTQPSAPQQQRVPLYQQNVAPARTTTPFPPAGDPEDGDMPF